ncbi:RidA family protein [Anaeromyxobacter sp. Red801]|uniref:RidA family protein n=1 Tax=Anaeromyxobacter sp. Red801 TaxID=3411632 RepID=UPI003BA12215
MRTAKLTAIDAVGAGIPGVSQATLVEGGRLLFLSGHVPLRPDGEMAGPSLEDQLEQTFRNLERTLHAAGGDFSCVARITIYVRDLSSHELPVIRAVRDRHVAPARPPASALLGVAELYHPDVRVEIDAIAAVG